MALLGFWGPSGQWVRSQWGQGESEGVVSNGKFRSQWSQCCRIQWSQTIQCARIQLTIKYPIDQALSSWLGTIQLANMGSIMLKALALIALKTLTSTWSQLGKAYPSL